MFWINTLKAGCLAVAFILGGCSYQHGIDLSLRSGKLHFSFDGKQPVAVQRLSVVELVNEARTVWSVESVDGNGRDLTELGYAVVPSGMKQVTAAAPLRAGQLYRVELLTMDGSGSQEFVISPEAENGQPDHAAIVRE